jgi:CMP-N,N'-diacetyllegionaminic acid synthase
MSVLGVIPARGGSKAVPKKNIRSLGGKPLIAWACEAAMAARNIDRLVCSTDSEEIATICRSYGVETPFMRPPELATDHALILDVLRYTLEKLDPTAKEFSHVCLVQATSPFVTGEMLDAGISLAREKDADTVITGTPCGQQHPSTMFTKDDASAVSWLLPDEQRMKRRQDFPPVFVRCGAVYVFRAALIRDQRKLYGERIFALETSHERAMTIDTVLDFKLAEFFLKEGIIYHDRKET